MVALGHLWQVGYGRLLGDHSREVGHTIDIQIYQIRL